MRGLGMRIFSVLFQQAWNISFLGTSMYQVVKKLSNVKRALREWPKCKPPAATRVKEATMELENI